MEGILELVTPLPEGTSKPGKGFEETMIKAENFQLWEIDSSKRKEKSCSFSHAGNNIKREETELAAGVVSTILRFSVQPFTKMSRWINGGSWNLVGRTGD